MSFLGRFMAGAGTQRSGGISRGCGVAVIVPEAETKGPVVAIEVGGDVRIRIPATTSKELACAVIKPVVAR
jgi:dihydroxyacid dehydratase/phosphogluconate dehydratase